MLSLHDLRAPAVALDWHEAVAVVATLTASLIDMRADACPAPSDVTLLPSGELRVSGPTLLPGAPAAALGGVLGQLLDTAPCPAELRQLAGRYEADDRTGPAGQDALVAFMTSLAFFERPNRQAVLAALADRAGEALERTRRLAALEALTERTRIAAGASSPWTSAVEPPAAEPPAAVAWETPAPESRWRLAVPAAAAIMVFVGMAFLAAAWFGDRTPPSDGRAEQVEEELPISGPGGMPDTAGARGATPERPPASPASSPAAGRTEGAAAGRAPIATPPTTAAPRPATVGPAPAAAGPQPAAPIQTPAPAAVTTPAPTSKRGGVDVAISEREGRVVPSPIAPVRPPSRPAAGGRVFTSSDAQVTPAVLIRPHLPEQPPPDVPEEQIGTLEFIVTESGAVEHVHLISPANRYQERMLVAAAKTWQFQPATRDGHPVRFRIRIRVTL